MISMFHPHVILGPPGCGKTRRLLELIVQELEHGAEPDRIAVVAV